MKKKTNTDTYEFSNTPIVRKYVEVLNNIESIRASRQSILQTHLNELCTYNIDDLEDRNAVIKRIISRELTYPSAFLASSLGFNRTTWNREYEKTLNDIGMCKRPKYSTLRNMVLFEKLKWLIIRFHERKQKRR